MHKIPQHLVLSTHKKTKRYRKTAKLLKLSKSTVQRMIQPIKIYSSQHKMGRPTMISERDGRLILRTLSSNPLIKPKKIFETLKLNCSYHTLLRFLLKK